MLNLIQFALLGSLRTLSPLNSPSNRHHQLISRNKNKICKRLSVTWENSHLRLQPEPLMKHQALSNTNSHRRLMMCAESQARTTLPVMILSMLCSKRVLIACQTSLLPLRPQLALLRNKHAYLLHRKRLGVTLFFSSLAAPHNQRIDRLRRLQIHLCQHIQTKGAIHSSNLLTTGQLIPIEALLCSQTASTGPWLLRAAVAIVILWPTNQVACSLAKTISRCLLSPLRQADRHLAAQTALQEPIPLTWLLFKATILSLQEPLSQAEECKLMSSYSKNLSLKPTLTAAWSR